MIAKKNVLHEWDMSHVNVHYKLILVLISAFPSKKSVKNLHFNKFTYCFNSLFSFNVSEWCNHCLFSQINSLAKKFQLIKKLKS